MTAWVIPLEQLSLKDLDSVGGKNSSLGEMISQLSSLGVKVPGGFATTAEAYRGFLARDGLADRINAELNRLDVDDVEALAETGARIRAWVLKAPLPQELEAGIRAEWDKLTASHGKDLAVAVRSSATAEDLPDASFAGQQETC